MWATIVSRINLIRKRYLILSLAKNVSTYLPIPTNLHKSPTRNCQYFLYIQRNPTCHCIHCSPWTRMYSVYTVHEYRIGYVLSGWISSVIDIRPNSRSVMETRTPIRRKEIYVWHRITPTSDIKPVFTSDIYLDSNTPGVLALRGLSDHSTCPRSDNCSENESRRVLFLLMRDSCVDNLIKYMIRAR